MNELGIVYSSCSMLSPTLPKWINTYENITLLNGSFKIRQAIVLHYLLFGCCIGWSGILLFLQEYGHPASEHTMLHSMSPIYFMDKLVSHYCVKYKWYHCIIRFWNNTFKKCKVSKPIKSLQFGIPRVKEQVNSQETKTAIKAHFFFSAQY